MRGPSPAAQRANPEIAPIDGAALSAAGLRYASDREAGFRRRRTRGGFVYLDDRGRPVRDRAQLERIRRLAIPPAYEDVWICADRHGHLQATGRDARGRKQYRYHAAWRTLRDGAKFERMLAFGAALSQLRRSVRRDLRGAGITRERVLAAVVRLLDVTGARVGNDEYVRANGSFGLTTLRNRHVKLAANGRVHFKFRGKGGVEHEIAVDDRRLSRIVRHCHELPGQRLFQYVDDAGESRPVDSGQVNDYLRAATGAQFTAKDFRTWTATLRAAELLSAVPFRDVESASEEKARIVGVVKSVAEELRNTPAVCRKSYINPLIFDAWREGAIDRATARGVRDGEALTLAILRTAGRRARRVGRRSLDNSYSRLKPTPIQNGAG